MVCCHMDDTVGTITEEPLLHDISQKVLTAPLHARTSDGFIHLHQFNEVPSSVEYSHTDHGCCLMLIIRQLVG